jgi:hypothetical protein
MDLVEQVGDLVEALVHGRRDDVAGRLVVVHLQDVFAEVGFHRLDAGRFERLVEARFLGKHGFRLGDLAHAVLPGDLGHQATDLDTIPGPEHRGAGLDRLLLETFQPQVEVVDDLVADRLRRVAGAFEIVEILDGIGATRDELALGVLQVALQDHVRQLGVDIGLEVHGLDFHVQASPASISATCSTLVLSSPMRRSLPSMFSRQPRSPPTTACAPLASTLSHLRSGNRRRDLAELDREGAAETAALLAAVHLLEFDALHLRQQGTRLLLDAHAAQAAAGVVVGDAALVVARHLVDLEHGDQEIGQFVVRAASAVARSRQAGSSANMFGYSVRMWSPQEPEGATT